jgi:predicted DNA-binding protein (MmcQ/YjbR family)
MTKSIPAAVREICLSFPNAEEASSHGSPDFKVEGKSFATFCVNHHGDGRVALWLRSPPGMQRLYTELNPKAYFVPPYVGSRGWLGVELNKSLDWKDIANRVREAYENASPASLTSGLDEAIRIEPPDLEMTPENINPMLGRRPQEVITQLAERCNRLPETSEGVQFGNPVWKAGKKTFTCAHYGTGRLQLQFWVGVEQQAMLTSDHRFSIPKYIGHNGWIDLDIEERVNWSEVDSLLETSYRHFALKRMIRALDNE